MIDGSAATAAALFPGEGEMIGAVQTKDWASTLLGPVAGWPPELRAAASICLNSNFPMAITWGADFAYLYNDAAIPIFGAKHPWALGERAADVWPEAWPTFGPLLQSVLDSGKATRRDDLLLVLERNGFPEECYFTFSYSPIRATHGAVGGVFVTVMETSSRVLAERRQRALSDLAAPAALRPGGGNPLDQVRQALARHLHDLPLAALFLADADGGAPAFCTGLADTASAPPGRQQAAAALARYAERCLAAGAALVFDATPLLQVTGPGGTAPPREVLGLPFRLARGAGPAGVLLLGVNPRTPLDAAHRAFLDGVAGHVAGAVAALDAIEAEQRRVAALEQEGELLRQIAEVRHDLASVMEGTSDAVISLDRDLRMLALNEAAAAAIGWPKAELIGRVLPAVVPQLTGSALEEALRDATEARRSSSAEHYHALNRCWYNVRCYPGPHGVVTFANDITSRKRAEQALLQAHAELERRVEERTEELREANQLLAAVFDRAPGGIAITDVAGRIVRVNEAYAQLTGYSQAELPHPPASERVDAADLARLRAGQARLLAGELAWFEVEMRYRRPDGRKLWVSNFVSMIEHARRGQRYFVAIARDITERKRVDAERQTSAQELRVLYERLQTVREAERTALAREVHDQLGQILSAAKIDIKLLESDLRAGKTPMARANIVAELGSASATLERAIGLVREIATELRAPELDEHGLYAAIAWHARDFERRTRIACQVAFDPQRPHPSRPAAAALLRIFQEATTNVLRHAQATQVRVILVRRAGALLLRVCDDGIGIGRRRLRAGGSLGLQGMRERAELVDGTLRVGPLTPRGTLVSARVPLAATKGQP